MSPNYRITIDDLGFCPEIEKSALELSGVSKTPIHTSWVANYSGPSAEFLASSCKKTSGLHFNVLEGPSLLKSPVLTDSQGSFNGSWQSFLWPSKATRFAVSEEMEAQLAKVTSWFGALSHCDSHLHLHAIPWIRRLMRDFQKKYHFEHIRTPYQPFSDTLSLNPKIYILLGLSLGYEKTSIPCFGISNTFKNDAETCYRILQHRGPRELVWHTMLGTFSGNLDAYRFLDRDQLELRQQEHRELKSLLALLEAAQ